MSSLSPEITGAASMQAPTAGVLRRVLRGHAGFTAWVFGYLLVGSIIAISVGKPEFIRPDLYIDKLFLLLAIWLGAFAFFYPVCIAVFVHPKQLFRYMANDLKANYFRRERLVQGFFVLLLLSFYFAFFTVYKVMIPLVSDYTWDPTFAALDRFLHGGVDPWRILHVWFGDPASTQLINFFYHLWFIVLYAVIFWQAFAMRNPQLRMQFFLTLVMSWALLGSLLGTLFASGGPCYFDLFVAGDNPFLPLMDYLHGAAETHRVGALNTQAILRESFVTGYLTRGQGISAMPSIHVSVSVLFAILGWRSHWFLGLALSAFAVVIFIGSVHLAWHYAIDGYVAALGTAVIWVGVGRLLKHPILAAPGVAGLVAPVMKR